MNTKFHRILNRMALFTVIVLVVLLVLHTEFLRLATTNIWINGIIIGAAIFGIGLSFVNMFHLVPEYRWMKKFFGGEKNPELPPRLLRPVAIMLTRARAARTNAISAETLDSFLDIIAGRFDDSRESLRYITNTLIFLGLLGTFWGLIHTVGGFATLVGAMNFDDPNVMSSVQSGLSVPMAGMSVAFASSLLGLGSSLVVGFLGLQMQLAQNAVFRELEENLADRTRIFGDTETAARELRKTTGILERIIRRITAPITGGNKNVTHT